MSHTVDSAGAEPLAGSSSRFASPMLIIGVMVVTAFVMILNETTVSIALPYLAEEMSVSATTVQWLISGFLVTMAIVIPTTGFLLERFAPRAVYLAAVGSFVVGTVLCGIAVNFPALLTDALGALSDDLYSHGSALLATLQQVAGAFGSAVLVTVAAIGSATTNGIPDAAGLRLAFIVASCIGVGAIVVALMYRRPDRTAVPAEGSAAA